MVNIKMDLKVSSCFTRDKDTLENTNSIILPRHFLEHIVKKKIDKYFFKVVNKDLGITSFCCVMEFTAPDDHVILPFWLMEYLAVDENSKLEVELVQNIIKGSKVILEPLDKEFFDIPESDAILEVVLSKFSLLQYNSVIKINIMDKKYLIKIKDITHNFSNMFNSDGMTDENELFDINMDVIDIINVDLGVELYNSFLAKELEQKKEEEALARKKEEEEIARRIKEEQEKPRILQKGTVEPKEKKFIPFSGKGRRLGD